MAPPLLHLCLDRLWLLLGLRVCHDRLERFTRCGWLLLDRCLGLDRRRIGLDLRLPPFDRSGEPDDVRRGLPVLRVVAGVQVMHGRLRLPVLDCFLCAGVAQHRHLLGQRAGELELADHALSDERLSEPLARLALADERLVELLLGDEAALDEDVPETAPAGGVLRPGGPTELGPLLRNDARELLARDAESLDEELAELLTRLALDLEGDADLAFGDEAALDEERADES